MESGTQETPNSDSTDNDNDSTDDDNDSTDDGSDSTDNDNDNDNDSTDEPTETPDAGPAPIVSDAAVELPLGESLLHHYDFSGTGTIVVDLVGEAHGEIIGGANLDATGGLTLDGIDDYVNLPNGLVSSLDAVTLAMWLSWRGGPCWQRVFDIGTSVDGEDVASYAATSIFVTPSSCAEAHFAPVQQNALSFEYHVEGTVHYGNHDAPLPLDQNAHVALSIDPEYGIVMYLQGVRVAEREALVSLADIIDDNVWLGRSQWDQDALTSGRLEDFRIYGAALSDGQVAELFSLGPDGSSIQ